MPSTTGGSSASSGVAPLPAKNRCTLPEFAWEAFGLVTTGVGVGDRTASASGRKKNSSFSLDTLITTFKIYKNKKKIKGDFYSPFSSSQYSFPSARWPRCTEMEMNAQARLCPPLPLVRVLHTTLATVWNRNSIWVGFFMSIFCSMGGF